MATPITSSAIAAASTTNAAHRRRDDPAGDTDPAADIDPVDAADVSPADDAGVGWGDAPWAALARGAGRSTVHDIGSSVTVKGLCALRCAAPTLGPHRRRRPRPEITVVIDDLYRTG